MATEIRVPTLGESVTEATIGKWFKKVGDAIAADEPLVELETDKVTIEVPAPAAGMLSEIAAKEGDTVGVGALLGAIGAAGGAAAAAKPDAVAQAAGNAGAETVKEAADKTAKIAGEPPIEERKPAGKTDMPPAPAASKTAGGKQPFRRPGRRFRQARPGAQGRRAGSNRQGRSLAAGGSAASHAGCRARAFVRRRRTARRARAHDEAPPDHRAAPQGSTDRPPPC